MKNLKYDVFISYAHPTNEIKHKDGNGLVFHFLEKIKTNFKNFSGTKLIPWLDDDQLACGDTLKKIDDDGLQNSKLFIPILTPAYYKSDWCRKEFLRFADLQSNTNNRILPIVFIPFDENDKGQLTASEREDFDKITEVMKQSGQGSILYMKFFEITKNRPRLPNPQNDFFEDQCEVFAQVLKTKLREVVDLKIDPIGSKPGIFLGLTSRKSLNNRQRIINELTNARNYGDMSYHLLPEESSHNSDSLEKLIVSEFEEQIDSLLNFSNISYHILDETYGAIPEGVGSTISVLELQYNIAAAKAKAENSDFKCFVQITTNELKDERQIEFIKKINSDIENYPDSIIKINFNNTKELSESLISALQNKKPIDDDSDNPKGLEQVLLLCCNPTDLISNNAKKIDDYLFNNDSIEVRKPILCSMDEDAEKDYKDSLKRCKKAIIFLGPEATPAWCNSKKIDILKSTNNKKIKFDKKAIYVTNPDVDLRINLVRSKEFTTINCEEKENLFFEQLDKFLLNDQ